MKKKASDKERLFKVALTPKSLFLKLSHKTLYSDTNQLIHASSWLGLILIWMEFKTNKKNGQQEWLGNEKQIVVRNYVCQYHILNSFIA